MSTTYRAPTDEETALYRRAVDEAIQGDKDPINLITRARKAIEGVFGECTYERFSDDKGQPVKGKTRVTQRSATDGVAIQFEINADLA
jgi:isocitrate dehydrogenase